MNSDNKVKKTLQSVGSKYINMVIEEDEEDLSKDNTVIKEITEIKENPTVYINDNIKVKKPRAQQIALKKYYADDLNVEIGVDEAGRGPLFGRVYSGAVILPKDDSFDHSKMKDSKKFHSKSKINEVAEYIKEYALAWSVGYESEVVIDNINILQATQQSMHKAISKTIQQYNKKNEKLNATNTRLLVDGNYFIPYVNNSEKNEKIPFVTVEGGDNKYSAIAAASILAKVARDDYIDELCKENPYLAEHYGIDSNKGYGAKKHIDGIKEHGITIWHRRSFGICKNY
jgi:ribonuclease HII